MSTEKIRQLNDAFRTTLIGGTIVMTPGVDDLPPCVKAHALVMVAEFTSFDHSNDPHSEHDFGRFKLIGQTFFWKIDYYDKQCEFASEDPSDPNRTTRVLTLMLAAEY